MSLQGPVKSSIRNVAHRGDKSPSPLGRAAFVGLRLLDLPLEYYLLHSSAESFLSYFNLPTVSHGIASITGVAVLDKLDLPLYRLVILAIATGSTAKQILWTMYPVALLNNFGNAIVTLLFACRYTSSLYSPGPTVRVFGEDLPLPIIMGGLVSTAGLIIETVSEHQRMVFKRDPRNRGKVCKSGLWGWARHINFFGHALSRGGQFMAASGPIAGFGLGLWMGYDLGTRAVSDVDGYCSKRYGEQWTQFKKDVPYRMVPGVY